MSYRNKKYGISAFTGKKNYVSTMSGKFFRLQASFVIFFQFSQKMNFFGNFGHIQIFFIFCEFFEKNVSVSNAIKSLPEKSKKTWKYLQKADNPCFSIYLVYTACNRYTTRVSDLCKKISFFIPKIWIWAKFFDIQVSDYLTAYSNLRLNTVQEWFLVFSLIRELLQLPSNLPCWVRYK